MTLRRCCLFGVLAVAGCAQILGISDPGGSTVIPGDGGVKPPDANPTCPAGMPCDGGVVGACAAAAQWGPVTNYSAAGGVAMAVGDVTHDGVIDVVVVTKTDVLLFPGMAGGGGMKFSFGASHALTPGTAIAATNVAVADVNGDGFKDVVTWSQDSVGGPGSPLISIHLQDPLNAGKYKAPTTLTVSAGGGKVRDLQAANFNGDASADLLVDAGGTAVRYIASGGAYNPTAEIVTNSANGVQAIDVDGDGLDDVVVTGSSGLQVYFNTPATPDTFGSPVTIGGNTSMGGIFGHFSAGSGRDLLLLNGTGGADLYVQDSPRTFSEHLSNAAVGLHTSGLPGEPVLAIDLNADTRDDVVAGNNYVVQCAAPKPLGTFFPSMSNQGGMLNTPATAVGLAIVADLDVNGKPDYLTFDSNSPQNGASLMEVYLQ